MYKKLLCASLLALGLNSIVLADDIGGSEFTAGVSSTEGSNSGSIYFGGQLGTTNMHYTGSSYLLPSNSYDNKNKFAARGYVGYAFSQFISAEFGYDYFGYPKFQDVSGNNQDILQHGADLMVKATLPLDYGFGVYGKAGLAWVYRSALNPNGTTFADKGANNKFTPIGALGVQYWFAPSMALDLAWTKTMSVSDLPTIDLFTVGLIYKINI